jgi:hypothetical protein
MRLISDSGINFHLSRVEKSRVEIVDKDRKRGETERKTISGKFIHQPYHRQNENVIEERK